MSKLRPERISGIVALTYLVLIPVGAFVAYRKIQILQEDVDTLWEKSGLAEEPRPPLVDVSRLLGGFNRR